MGVLSNALFLVALTAAVAFVSAEDTIKNAVDDLTTTKSGATWCPVPLVGTQCPDSSIFHYYKCCGDLNKDCCFNLQVWVIVVLAVIGVILIAGFVLSLVRCIFCR